MTQILRIEADRYGRQHLCPGDGCAMCRWASGELNRLFFDSFGRPLWVTPQIKIPLFSGSENKGEK